MKIKEGLASLKARWDAIPDKSVAVKIPLKLSVVIGVAVLMLALALAGARRVEAQFAPEPVTKADFAELSAKVSACVPATKIKATKKR